MINPNLSINIEKVIPKYGNSFLAVHYSNKYFSAPFHRHTEYELILIEEGNGLSLVGNGIKKLAKDDFILIGSNVPHIWLSDDEYYTDNTDLLSKSTYAQFGTNIFPENMHNIPEMANIYHLLQESHKGLYFKECPELERIKKTFRKLPKKSGFKRLISLYEILNHLSTYCFYEYFVNTKYKDSLYNLQPKNEKYHRVINYLNCNYQEQLSLQDIASKAQMNPAALCRYFKNITGKTLFNYIRNLRIDYATKLLVNSNLPIKKIAYDCGYNYISFFNRQFKALKNLNPTEYRNLYRHNNNNNNNEET